MKRDMDLCRQILLTVETAEEGELSLEKLLPTQISKPIFDYHLELLFSARLLEKVEVAQSYYFSGDSESQRTLKTKKRLSAVKLNWQGHEFLDAARDDRNWEQAKQVGNKVGGLTLDVMKAVLIGLAKEQLRGLGLPVV